MVVTAFNGSNSAGILIDGVVIISKSSSKEDVLEDSSLVEEEISSLDEKDCSEDSLEDFSSELLISDELISLEESSLLSLEKDSLSTLEREEKLTSLEEVSLLLAQLNKSKETPMRDKKTFFILFNGIQIAINKWATMLIAKICCITNGGSNNFQIICASNSKHG